LSAPFSCRSLPPPCLISTVRQRDRTVKLLNFTFETNPPADPEGDLDSDPGSLYDRNLTIRTSPLEIIYHTRTLHGLLDVFR
jgi:hypothetical protein